MNIDLIRSQFPALALQHDGQPRTYLDNPAGTQVPNQVLDAMRTAMVEFNANMHGCFRTSELATELEHEAHVLNFAGDSLPGIGIVAASTVELGKRATELLYA